MTMQCVDAAQLDLRQWVRHGDGIVTGQGTAEPLTLTEALVAQRGGLGGVRLFLAAMFSDTFLPVKCNGIEIIGMGGVGSNRRLIKAGVMRGTLSRIVAQLSGPVTTARSDVDVAGTENSAARLRGLPLKLRVRAMIGLAAPQHRDALAQRARALYGV